MSVSGRRFAADQARHLIDGAAARGDSVRASFEAVLVEQLVITACVDRRLDERLQLRRNFISRAAGHAIGIEIVRGEIDDRAVRLRRILVDGAVERAFERKFEPVETLRPTERCAARKDDGLVGDRRAGRAGGQFRRAGALRRERVACAKIDLRKRLATELGISLNTLRLRALRIREKLQVCIEECLSQYHLR